MKLPSPAPIYLDHHATTPVDPRVAAAVLDVMTNSFGNANSSEHIYGELAAARVAESREQVAELLGAAPEGVHFTTGSTDGIRLALAHAVASVKGRPIRVAVTAVEHRAVLDALAFHERLGDVVVQVIGVDKQARLDMPALDLACRDGVDLVCVMAANNEVGTLYPIESVAKLARAHGAATLVDATQAAGRVDMRALDWGVTYLTVSAHKIYGPKGIGALVVPAGLQVRLTSSNTPGAGDGTPNVPGIVGLGEACHLRHFEMGDDEPRMCTQRDRLESLLLTGIDGLVVNGDREHRLANNLHVSVPDVPNDAVVARLRRHVAISTGAACSSGAQEPSHVLQAMGLPVSLQDGALRIGLGRFTTDDDVTLAGHYIVEAVAATRATL